MKATVLVTDADQRAALAVVRSLGRAGYQVHAGSSRSRSLAGASRYCRSHVALPDPLAEPERFGEAVRLEARRVGAAVILLVWAAAAAWLWMKFGRRWL